MKYRQAFKRHKEKQKREIEKHQMKVRLLEEMNVNLKKKLEILLKGNEADRKHFFINNERFIIIII